MIRSIQTIHQVIDTGDKPVLVTCNDLNDYVCKHNRTGRVAVKLFSELLCNNLLKALGVKTPPFEFVSVLEEHTLIQADCQPAFLRTELVLERFISRRLWNGVSFRCRTTNRF